MRLTVSDGKQEQEGQAADAAVVMPTAVATSSAAERKFLTKKRVISAVVAVVVTAIVVIGILVGIWIFTENQKLTLQYTMSLISTDKTKAQQDVSTNIKENIVQYHVTKENREWWIINDYNKDLQIAKVKEENGRSYCYLKTIDLSKNAKPAAVSAPNKDEIAADDAISESELTTVASAPVSDSSFIGKTASDLCAGSPVYWTYPVCDSGLHSNTTMPSREKRAACTPCGCRRTYCVPCGWVSWYYVYYPSLRIWRCTWSWWSCAGYAVYYNC